MHGAFDAEVALTTQKPIVALHAYANKLLICDAQLTLTHYQIGDVSEKVEEANTDAPYKTVQVLQALKHFCKSKPIQMHAVKETGLLLVLVDNYLSIYSLSTLSLSQKLASTKGAVSFAVYSTVDHDSGIPVLKTQVAVCVKRQVLLFTWLDSEFDGERHYSCPDRAKVAEFLSGDMLVVGMTSDFVSVNISGKEGDAVVEAVGAPSLGTGSVSTTMGYLGSRTPKPMLVRTKEQLLIVRDVTSAFIDKDCNVLPIKPIKWATAPEFIGYTYPFLIVVLKTRLEVRNAQSGSLLQTFDVQGVQVLNDGKCLFAATSTTVYRFVATPYLSQVEELIFTGQLDEALSLLDVLESVLLEDNKEASIRRVKDLKARQLFEQGRYEESMDLFGECWTPPSSVIALFPTDQPANEPSASAVDEADGTGTVTSETTDDVQKVTEDPEHGDASTVISAEANRALSAYLARTRRILSRYIPNPPAADSADQYFTTWPDARRLTVDEMETELGLADTALLKLYIQHSPGLVGSLVRLANRCDPAVVKDYLAKEDRWRELVDFYYGKQLHGLALALLRERGAVDAGIQYIQRLDAKDWGVITEYAPWLLKSDPDALDIFTDASQESATFDRRAVVHFMKNCDTKLAIRYLEHVVIGLGDTSPQFSEDLAALYIETDQVITLQQFIESDSNGASAARLYKMLPEKADFAECRAFCLADMGNLKGSLEIYVNKVKDEAKTQAFAERQLNRYPNVFEVLLQLYLSDKPPQLQAALQILERHGPRLNVEAVLSQLPPDIAISDIRSFLTTRLRDSQTQRYASLVEQTLRRSAMLSIQLRVIERKQKAFTITADKVCAACHKRVGGSVLAAFPDGAVVHYVRSHLLWARC
ncbi:vacuolar sorting protein 39 domain 2-domain-containing protein [Protomyces lactucae-debilis]|uniref:Vacuolar sorting protein 39 domain 2-domain-containing protein n=1 Tax=Protomyces lactucae-debilis TaxID=2754530 RepID=A0A1Y2FSQ0_PROLT|nr:vacuolar sorting protein 39 domain 2-domain-containing protein [Protomyces lactucae-debilis]ORY86998.1 vacuolar sorting protein 39 domain 2-domain-containing protein [Protomyces lactucae-debilis]